MQLYTQVFPVSLGPSESTLDERYLFFFRSFNTNVIFLCCYVTLHIQHTQPLSDEKNES